MPGIDPTSRIALPSQTDNVYSHFEAAETRDALDFKDASPQIISPPFEPVQIKRPQAEIDWENCKIYSKRSEEIKCLEDFIYKNPESENVPEAYYLLGRQYFAEREYERGIEMYENLVYRYPSSNQASNALDRLVIYHFYVGDDERSLSAATSWLKRKPYKTRGYSAPPRNYQDIKARVLFFLAEHYKRAGKFKEAKKIFAQVVSGSDDFIANAARGAPFELTGNPKYKKYALWYFVYKFKHALKRGHYFLHTRRDYQRAGRIFTKIAEQAKTPFNERWRISYYIEEAEMALEEIKLRRMHFSSQILKAVDDLEKRGKIWAFLQYQRLGNWGFSKLSKKMYLQLLLLNSCKDVEEVRIALLDSFATIDEETKTPKNYYLLMFRSKGVWHVIGNGRDLKLKRARFKTDKFEDAVKAIEKSTRSTIPSISWKKEIFSRSLKEYYGDSLSAYKLIVNLKKQGLSEKAKRMVDSLQAKINGGKKKRKKLLSFAEAYSILPKHHFDGLKIVDFDWSIKRLRASGTYHLGRINLAVEDSDTAIHEIGHHWDIGVERGNDGKDQSSGDRSLIFYKISWDAWDKVSCSDERKPCGKWKRKPKAEKEDFARNYGMSDGFEDKATSKVSYVEGKNRLARPEVRKQMKKGNFEPAVKYLFNKYIEHFDPTDGLCFEYNITKKNPPLSMAEVKMNLRAWLIKHPDSVAQSTLTAIKEIEDEYCKTLEVYHFYNKINTAWLSYFMKLL
ncbi:MAG: hypothetical protein U9R38_00105 [Candidatus Margulisiibacteriota bacterium]|nr:hypothetical protein [Candidatus Margulisiibacteriota bacterium]